jgi:hypothetical protein
MLVKSLSIASFTLLSSLPLSACIDSGNHGSHSDFIHTAAYEDNYTDGLFDGHLHHDHSIDHGRSGHAEGSGRYAGFGKR